MKTAQELYEISQTKAPEMVTGILEGVREHIIKRCEEEANKGATYYSIYLKRGLCFIKDLLLAECVALVKEFEDNGYKVTIEDDGNDYYLDLIITFSWNEREVDCCGDAIGGNKLLYKTSCGIVDKK